MGAWTVMWNGGASVGPLLGGILMGSVGRRGAFGTVLVLGLAGAVLFMLLATGRPLQTITEESAPVVRDAERPTPLEPKPSGPRGSPSDLSPSTCARDAPAGAAARAARAWHARWASSRAQRRRGRQRIVQ